MSKHINVNPDHYKVAGRERPGNAVAKAPKSIGHDPRAAQRREELNRRSRAKSAATATTKKKG